MIILKHPNLYTSMAPLQPPSPPHRGPPVCPQQRPGTEPGLCGVGSPRRDPAGPHPLDAGASNDTVRWERCWTLMISDIVACSYGHISDFLCRYGEGGTRYNFTKLDQLIELLWINGLRPGIGRTVSNHKSTIFPVLDLSFKCWTVLILLSRMASCTCCYTARFWTDGQRLQLLQWPGGQAAGGGVEEDGVPCCQAVHRWVIACNRERADRSV